jgi:acyl-CoA synthetase (AMP-forming)/AMP-acid ligase II
MASMYNGSIKQLAFLPFYHIFGLFAVYYWFAFFGRTFVFLKDYSPDTIARTCRRHEVTHIFAVPLLWHTVEEKIQKGVRMMPEEGDSNVCNSECAWICPDAWRPLYGQPRHREACRNISGYV